MQLFAKSPERSSKSWFSEIARVLVRFDHVVSPNRKRESRRCVSGCRIARNWTALLAAWWPLLF